ncbi:MAG: ABC transporter permease [Helicobacteraceae bacterium]
MRIFLKILKDFPRYALGGLGSLGSLFLLFGLWEAGHQLYGDLVLPSVLDTFAEIKHSFYALQEDIILTVKRGFGGFLLAGVFGSFLGLFAGFFVSARVLARPITTVILGMPPIAWIVLSMIWFGMNDFSVIFTVFVSSFPIVFLGALSATATLEGSLKEMAQSFGFTKKMLFFDLYLPHIFSYVFPSVVTSLGVSWKIVIMAELLSASDGMGAQLAIARSNLDSTGVFALVSIMIFALLLIEYGVLEPVKREVEAWRN